MISDLSKTEAGGHPVVACQMAPGPTSDLCPPTSVLVPCISLWQPWAQWIMLGWKTIETRTHARFESLTGQRIGVHAAKVWDKQAIHIARPYLTDAQFDQTFETFRVHHHDSGKVLGTVFVNEHRLLDSDDAPAALIECQTVRYGLLLRDPIKLAVPFPVTGRQGIFHVELLNA